jgi:5-methylcytosine-specific restriction protein B
VVEATPLLCLGRDCPAATSRHEVGHGLAIVKWRLRYAHPAAPSVRCGCRSYKTCAVALSYPERRVHIQAVVDAWRERCLVEDGSLLFDDEQVWTADLLGRAHHNIAEEPLLDGRTFTEKLKQQLSAERQLILLGAEVLVVYYLFLWHGAVGPATKRARVNEILGWADAALPEDSEVFAALGEPAIGSPGQFYLVRPDVQLGCALDFARRLKSLSLTERRATLDDPWQLRDFIDGGEAESSAGMRHILLHLLQPDFFEPIVSGQDRRAIATAYSDLVDDELDDVDEQLYAIHARLSELLERPATELDFYDPPLHGTWGDTSAGDDAGAVDALELKRQIVLFGPPGTSKTYSANELAAIIIRRHALRAWGPAAYFQRLERVDAATKKHVRRLQLHPAYSYEEFIRGLRLRDGGLVYEDGYLPRLIEEIDSEDETNSEPELPWVLILDEINRADLSRVFGEAFSLLESRNQPIELPGVEPGEPPASLRMPERLYVIGTMNLIDQSLEQIDFALRRRFLWRRCGFDPVLLADVLEQLWEATDTAARYPWDRVASEMHDLVERASALNAKIDSSGLLGRDYELGHTYFFDIVALLSRSERLHRRVKASTLLWSRKHEPLAPVRDLWRMSLEPLLDQYLQGADPTARQSELSDLRGAFFGAAE